MGDLNWNLDVILGLICSFIVYYMAFLTFKRFNRKKFGFLFYLSLVLFSVASINTFDCIANLFYIKSLFIYKNLLFIPMSYFIALLIDSLMRDSVDPFKFSVNTGLSIALILEINPNEVDYFTFYEGTVVFTSLGILLFIRVLFFIWIFGNMFILLVKIHIHCPKSIKKYSTLSLFGGIMIGPVLLISILIPYPFPGQIYIIQSLGFIIFSIGFFLKEDLAFVLPFKAIRLAVIKTDSAICLYGFKWIQDTKIIDDLLFSGMLQAVSNFIDESLDKGQIDEIRLPQAVLMIQRNIKTQIACVLVTTKTSHLLRDSLKLFLDRFISQYSLTNSENISQYSSATQIVKEVFPFIPDYQ